ncbi:unnamed protein product [Dimorphilus gyrociliatus]|uniref:Uncharacterized protein n=1 Tax=Dimorphilus gyrociliatus TaxID=2664684 RepID=A0A7I8V927_9ANNE|nr:unnamed protein product [Dimorphilus gyrociliatus]
MAVTSAKRLDHWIIRNTGKHRAPGICAALFGFLLMFTGILVLTVGKSVSKKGKVNKSISDLEDAGPAFLSIGILLILIGFTYQYIRHKRFKKALTEKRKRKLEGRANDYVMTDDEHFEGIDSLDPVEEFQMDEPSTSTGIVLNVVSLPNNSVQSENFLPEIVTETVPKNDHSNEIIPPRPPRSHSARSLRRPSLQPNQRSLSQTNIQQASEEIEQIEQIEQIEDLSLNEKSPQKTKKHLGKQKGTGNNILTVDCIPSLRDSPSQDYIPKAVSKGFSNFYSSTKSESGC